MMDDQLSRMNEPDPDQLMRSLDVALAQARAKNSHGGANRNTFRVMSIVVIVVVLLAVLAALQYMASELTERQPQKRATPPAGEAK